MDVIHPPEFILHQVRILSLWLEIISFNFVHKCGRWDTGRLRILTRETMGSVVDSTLARLDLRFEQSQYRGEKKDLRNQAVKGFICRLAGGNTFWVKMKEVCHEP